MARTPAVESNLSEVLQQVAREKDIDFERWISALEDAMASAAKKQHRIKAPVRSTFDPETGKFEAFIVKTVAEEIEDPLSQWTLEEAQDHQAEAQIGDEIHIPISTEGLGRIAAQSAKQVLYQRIREAEREKIYNEFIASFNWNQGAAFGFLLLILSSSIIWLGLKLGRQRLDRALT